jgi:tetratricopeptide (TPR) repeat protein
VDPNLRVGDGVLLRSVLSEIITKNLAHRPIQVSLFRQVEADNLSDAEPFMSPSGLTAEFKAPETPQQWLRRTNLPKAMVMRYLPNEKSRFDPSPEFALSNYGTMYMDLANFERSHGRVEEAMPLYARAVSVTTPPNKAEAFTHWGIALASQGKLDEAIDKFNDALKVKPLFEAYANLAGAMNTMKRYADAEPYARQAIAMQPGNGQSWNNLAISLYYRGKTADAVQALEQALTLNPQDATIQANLKAIRSGK